MPSDGDHQNKAMEGSHKGMHPAFRKASRRHHRCSGKEQQQSEKKPHASVLFCVLPFAIHPSAGVGSRDSSAKVDGPRQDSSSGTHQAASCTIQEVAPNPQAAH